MSTVPLTWQPLPVQFVSAPSMRLQHFQVIYITFPSPFHNNNPLYETGSGGGSAPQRHPTAFELSYGCYYLYCLSVDPLSDLMN